MSLTPTPAPDGTVANSLVGRERRGGRVDLVDVSLPVVAILCLVVHVALLIVTGTSMLVMVAPMLVLSGLCVAFTCRKGNGHRVRKYAVTAGSGIAMLAVHGASMSSMLGHPNDVAMDHAAMGHGAMDMAVSGNLSSAGLVDGLMQAGLVFAGVQVMLAVGVAVRALRASSE
jgi:hypothetical protein